MSVYETNEYVISSNNSINENKYNMQKASSKSHKIKSILKPLLKMLKVNSDKKKKQLKQPYYCAECDDNTSNEDLEGRLYEEMEDCPSNSAILVCDNNGHWNLTPVHKGQTIVPVHFARTEAGTFFWTSAIKAEDSDLISSYCYTECQDAAEQMPIIFGQDRWVQA